MGIKGNQFISIVEVLVKNTGPLHIGNGDGEVLVETDENRAYIPATSIAGSFKSYLSYSEGKPLANKIFGSGIENSKISIYDAVSTEKINMEIRPGIKIDPVKGTSLDGRFFKTEYIGVGHSFKLQFEIFAASSQEKAVLISSLYKCLNALMQKRVSLGGKKTSGAGQFEIKTAEQTDYNLQKLEGLMSYIKREKQKSISILPDIAKTETKDQMAVFTLQGRLRTPLLVKGQNTFDANLADAQNIRNCKDEYIIPGSSLKGALRGHLARIASYLGKEALLEEAFGNETENKENRSCGRVFVSDTKIMNSKDHNPYFRIKIDKFTGGVMKGALMSEQPILGDIDIQVGYKGTGTQKEDDSIIGLLCLGLRDFAQGNIALGSGNSIGRGRLECSKMVLDYQSKKTVFNFEEKTIDDQKAVDNLVQTLMEWRNDHGI